MAKSQKVEDASIDYRGQRKASCLGKAPDRRNPDLFSEKKMAIEEHSRRDQSPMKAAAPWKGMRPFKRSRPILRRGTSDRRLKPSEKRSLRPNSRDTKAPSIGKPTHRRLTKRQKELL